MPGRDDFTRLIADVSTLQSADPAVKNIQEKTAALEGEVKSLMEPGEGGWKLLTRDTKDSLIEKYEKTLESIQKYLDTPEKEEGKDAEIRKSMTALQNFLTEDLAALRSYDPALEPKSLPTLFEDARTITLEPNGKRLDYMSGALSSRIPMKINLHGKTVSGVFTLKKSYDPAATLTSAFEEALQKVPAKNRERARALFDSVLSSPKSFKSAGPDVSEDEKETKKGRVIAFLNNTLKSDPRKGYSAPKSKILNAFAYLNDMKPAEVEKILGSKCLAKLGDVLVNGEIVVNANAGIPDGANIPARNVAMSRVADLLGVPEVIARSVPMKLKCGDEVFEGVFMEKAKGIDKNHPNRTPGYVNRFPLNRHSGEGLRQAADLQVLDYICGNIDRHPGNMFYQFDANGKLSGVQGIDNDTAFGTLVPETGRNKLASVKQLQFVSADMAIRIQNTTPEQLRMTLHGLVEEKCIDAACKRLKQVKDQINKCKKMDLKNVDGKDHPLIPLKKEGFARSFVTDLLDRFGFTNIFARVRYACSHIAERKNSEIRIEKEFMEIGNENRATRGGVYAEFDKAGMMGSQLKGATSGRRTSPNYTAVETAVAEYRKFQAGLINRMKDAEKRVKAGETDPAVIQAQRVTGRDFAEMQKRLRAMKQAADIYRTNKLQEIGGEENASKYQKKRLDTVKLVGEFAEKSLEMKPEEEEEINVNQRRTTEEVVRGMNRPKEVDPAAALQ